MPVSAGFGQIVDTLVQLFHVSRREVFVCLHTHLPRCKTCLSFHSYQTRNTTTLVWIACYIIFLVPAVMVILAILKPLRRRAVVEAALRTDHGDFLCVVCCANRKDRMLKPCNHVCLCSECATEIYHHLHGRCPICRGTISGVERVYL